MTISSASAYRIPVSDLKLISTDLKAVKLTPEMEAKLKQFNESMVNASKAAEEFQANAANLPTDEVYATVKVNGKVVATLYNSGSAMTPTSFPSGLSSFTESEKLVGPALAQKRAEELAARLGGTIEKASTALTPSTWTHVSWDAKGIEARQKALELRQSFMSDLASLAAKTRFEAQVQGQADTPA